MYSCTRPLKTSKSLPHKHTSHLQEQLTTHWFELIYVVTVDLKPIFRLKFDICKWICTCHHSHQSELCPGAVNSPHQSKSRWIPVMDDLLIDYLPTLDVTKLGSSALRLLVINHRRSSKSLLNYDSTTELLKLFGTFHLEAVLTMGEGGGGAAWNLMLLHPCPSPSHSLAPVLVEQFGLDWISPTPECLSVSAPRFLSCLFSSFRSNRLQRLWLREAHQRQVHAGLLVPSVVHVQELHHGDDLSQQHWVSGEESAQLHDPTFFCIICI